MHCRHAGEAARTFAPFISSVAESCTSSARIRPVIRFIADVVVARETRAPVDHGRHDVEVAPRCPVERGTGRGGDPTATGRRYRRRTRRYRRRTRNQRRLVRFVVMVTRPIQWLKCKIRGGGTLHSGLGP